MIAPAVTAMWREMQEQPEVLRRAIEHNHATLERTRRLTPSRVQLVGHGSSRHAARFGAMLLEAVLGWQASVAPAPDQDGGPARFAAGELVIALSQSGETPSVVAAARRAVRAGARLVTVTNNATSALAGCGGEVLGCAAGAETAIPATKSFLAEAGLLLALARGDRPVLQAAAAAERLLGDPPGLVVRPRLVAGAGLVAPIAAEVALKFAEAAGHLAAACDAAEALHGPVTASDGALLILASRRDGNVEALARVPGAVALVASEALPGTGDPAADALVLAVAGQVLAHNLALADGRDPDHPPGLSKVTHSF